MHCSPFINTWRGIGRPRTPLKTTPANGRDTRSNADPSTSAVAAVGFPVLETLQNLVLRNVEGVDKLSFLFINSAGKGFSYSLPLLRQGERG